MQLKTKQGSFIKEKGNCDKMASHIKVSHRHRDMCCLCVVYFDQKGVSPQLQAQQTEKTIREDFQKLYQFLRATEAARIDAVRREATIKSEAMKIRIVNLTAEISSLTDRIKTTQREMKAKDISFLLVMTCVHSYSDFNIEYLTQFEELIGCC